MFQLNNLSSSVLLRNISQSIGNQVRFAKSPAQSQTRFKKVHIRYGLKKNPGDRVDERMLIGTQKHYHYHPGMNVGVNPRDKSLYAICAGTVYYSIERFHPNENNPIVAEQYSNTLRPLYKKYIHVVPDKATNDFKLTDLV